MTEAQQKAKRKYLAKGKRIIIDFYPTEADLIAHVEKQPKKQTYIKDLIREDIKKECKKVYVVLWGRGCEAEIMAVYARKKDAIKHLNENYPKWEKISPDYRKELYFSNGKMVEGVEYVSVEDWDVD